MATPRQRCEKSTNSRVPGSQQSILRQFWAAGQWTAHVQCQNWRRQFDCAHWWYCIVHTQWGLNACLQNHTVRWEDELHWIALQTSLCIIHTNSNCMLSATNILVYTACSTITQMVNMTKAKCKIWSSTSIHIHRFTQTSTYQNTLQSQKIYIYIKDDNKSHK